MSGQPSHASRRPRRKEHHEEEEHENAERWLLSYADMITLLMALFIVLFAISQVDQKKLLQLSAGLEQYFGEPAAVTSSTGILDGSPQAAPDGQVSAVNPPDPTPVVAPSPGATASPTSLPDVASRAQTAADRQRQDMLALKHRIASALAARGLRGAVQFEIRDNGLVVNIVTDRVLFGVGDATLRPEGKRVLATIAPTMRRLPNGLTIEGHTDNVPITGRFASNWELSTARATTVLHYLLGRGVPGARLSAAGYADQRPLASNATAAGRARNRRVAIVVLPRGTTTTPTSSSGD